MLKECVGRWRLCEKGYLGTHFGRSGVGEMGARSGSNGVVMEGDVGVPRVVLCYMER